MTQAAQAEGEDEQHDAEGDSVGADQPRQTERARAWKQDQQHAEEDREDAAKDHRPFAGDSAAQLDGRHDLQDARDDAQAAIKKSKTSAVMPGQKKVRTPSTIPATPSSSIAHQRSLRPYEAMPATTAMMPSTSA